MIRMVYEGSKGRNSSNDVTSAINVSKNETSLQQSPKKLSTHGWSFNELMVEVGVLWASEWMHGRTSRKEIAKRLGIKVESESQVSNELAKIKLVAPFMRDAVNKLTKAGFFVQLYRYEDLDKKRTPRFAEAITMIKLARQETMKAKLKRGMNPFGRKAPHTHKPYTTDKKGYYQLPENDATKNLRFAVKDCATEGQLGSMLNIAKRHKVPSHNLKKALEDPFFKGYINETEKGVHPALVGPETWDKAHAWWLLARQKERHGPPFCTKWLGKDLTPDDPDNMISQIIDQRLMKKGYKRIAKALERVDPETGKKMGAGVNAQTVQRVLKHLELYVNLGMISAEKAKKLEQISLPPDETIMVRLQRAKKLDNRERLIDALRPNKRLRTCEIMRKTGLDKHAVHDHLSESKLVDREPGHFGRWFLKSPQPQPQQ